MSSNLEPLCYQYLKLVESHVETWPGYKALYRFLSVKQEHYQQPVQITRISITTDESLEGSQLKINFGENEGPSELEEELLSPSRSKGSCCLFIIENICPRTMSLLGKSLDIDPQFFADHLNSTSWYRIVSVGDRRTALPSMQKLQDFIQLRFVEIRKVVDRSNPSIDVGATEKENDSFDSSSDANSFVVPDETTTHIPRKAGKLTPRNREGYNFEPLLCIRQVVSVWSQKRKLGGDDGWTGIILLDPPFKMTPGGSTLKPSEYRSFRSRLSFLKPSTQVPEIRESNHKTLIEYIRARFEGNRYLLGEAKAEPFFILGDLYRLVASNWIVVNEYLNRELSTIEYILEKEEPSFRNLEIYLKEIYVYRRRCTKYHELITEAKNQCNRRGQKCWPRNIGSDLAVENGKELEEDFIYLQAKTTGTLQRIQKNINLLTALVAIGEGKQGLQENRGIVRLSLPATVFLPFSTVASILGMQGNYAPGADGFWLFWAVAIPVTALIVTSFVLYEGFRKPVFRRLRNSGNLWTGRRNRICSRRVIGSR